MAERGEAILAAEPATPVSDASGDPANVMPAQAVDPSIRVPRSIHDISNGDHILGFGAQLGEDHPVCQMHVSPGPLHSAAAPGRKAVVYRQWMAASLPPLCIGGFSRASSGWIWDPPVCTANSAM